MSFEERYVKVTILIEDSETVRKITIPKAREIDIHYEPAYANVVGLSNDGESPWMRNTRPSAWSVRGMADFDYNLNRTIVSEHGPRPPMGDQLPLFDLNEREI